MASPFKFFRKHQAGMMVVLVILSMLLFTLDSLFMTEEPNFWLLGLLLGGAVFGIAGIRYGRWLHWGIGGALLGAVLGLILPDYMRPPSVISTSLGNVGQREFEDLEMRRFLANRFLVQATEASFGEGTGQFAQQFSFGEPTMERDVLFGKLLRAKADALGIAVTKPMINDFIHRATADKLKVEDFARIYTSMRYKGRQMDEDTLFDILGDQLKATLAYQVLQPAVASLPPAPEVYWQYFRRLNVRQQLNLAPLEVDAFLDQVGEPGDSEVQQLFSEYKSRYPNELEPGSPGFRLRHRMQLAYLELDYETMEGRVAEVTDADIEKYYEENKDLKFSTPVLPENRGSQKDDASTPEAEAESEAATPDSGADTESATPEAGDTEAPETPEPAETESPQDPGDSQAADPESAPESADDAADSPVQETDPDSAPAPESTESADGENSTESPDADADVSEEPASEDPAAADQPEDSCNPFAQDEQQAADDTAENQEPDPAQPESPADAADTADAPTADEVPAVEPADPEAAANSDDQTADEASPAAEPDAAAAAEDSAALSLEIPAAADQDGDAGSSPQIEYEYRELNQELRDEIRDEILRVRVQEAIDKKMDNALAQMRTLANKRADYTFSLTDADPEKYSVVDDNSGAAWDELRTEVGKYAEELNAELKQYAEKNGFEYVETPLLSDIELYDEEEYPIGRAVEPQDNPFAGSQTANVTYTVFSPLMNQSGPIEPRNIDTQLYVPREAVTQSFGMNDSGSHYAYWPIDFSLSHVPTLDEPGVREQVVLTWKRLKARELAEKRAEELAAEVRTAVQKEGEEAQTMAEVLEDKTVTGKPGGTDVNVRTTQPFSWLKTPLTAQQSFQTPPAELSTIQFSGDGSDVLERVGGEFMKSVFEEMDDEDVQVVPNADRSRYYIVHVTNRFPTKEIGEDELRERFLNEGQQVAFARSPMMPVMQNEIVSPAISEWRNSIWREFGVDPDSEPEE